MSSERVTLGGDLPGGTRMRPRYHFTPDVGWINDPIAGLRHGGRWHLFVQANPDEPVWGLMRWRHLVSNDLTEWTSMGLALEPTPNGPDEGGCWSGSVTTVGDAPVFFYTAARGAGDHHRQAVVRAHPVDDQLERLVPELHAPLVLGDNCYGTDHQRDPFVLRWQERWLMLLGTGLRGAAAGGAVVAWTSADGDTWRWQGVVFSRAAEDPSFDAGEVWECPQLVRVNDRWILIVSVQARNAGGVDCIRTLWFSGEFDGQRFAPNDQGVFDGGDTFYAPSLIDSGEDGRTLLVGWLQESRAARAAGADGYSGALSVTRELRVSGGVVGVHPVGELARRFETLAWVDSGVEVAAGAPHLLGEPGSAFRLQFRLDSFDGWAGAVLGEDGDRRRWTVAVVDGARRRLVVGESHDGALFERWVAELPASGEVDIDVLVDGSIVEAFASGRVISARVDPTLDTSCGVWLVAGAAVACTAVEFSGVQLAALTAAGPVGAPGA